MRPREVPDLDIVTQLTLFFSWREEAGILSGEGRRAWGVWAAGMLTGKSGEEEEGKAAELSQTCRKTCELQQEP